MRDNFIRVMKYLNFLFYCTYTLRQSCLSLRIYSFYLHPQFFQETEIVILENIQNKKSWKLNQQITVPIFFSIQAILTKKPQKKSFRESPAKNITASVTILPERLDPIWKKSIRLRPIPPTCNISPNTPFLGMHFFSCISGLGDMHCSRQKKKHYKQKGGRAGCVERFNRYHRLEKMLTSCKNKDTSWDRI